MKTLGPLKKHTTTITSKSVEQSGLPSDYKRAIAEYIWNGFDAKASKVSLEFNANELGYINSFTISDNGEGIDLTNIANTFGHFLDSNKTGSYDKDGFVKGKKGKGRYAFSTFCNRAVWQTVFKKEDNFLEYKITILKGSQQNFETSDQVLSKDQSSGTIVHFHDFFALSADHLTIDEFEEFLAGEFGWFLFLNKENEYSIEVNGKPIDYFRVIADFEEQVQEIGSMKFAISFLRWNRKIGDKYFYYFLDDNKKEVSRKHTSFNNKKIEFHHSVYVESSYFNTFRETENDNPVLGIAGQNNQTDGTYKALTRFLNKYVLDKEKKFIRESQAERLLSVYHKKHIFPAFRNNAYENLRQKDLENVVRELYCVQPQIFQGLKTDQSKTLVGFLNLLLDTDQREKVLDIMEGIVKLSDEERNELSTSLKKTKIANITSIIRLLESRYNCIQILKQLVFELEKFTNERDHIQKVIEANYWLFGEQYHLVSADQNFEILLHNYLCFFEKGEKVPTKIESKNKLKRPDILICRQSNVPDPSGNEYTMEENIIVELKRPSVVIGKKQYNQIEDYLRFIVSEPRFNSQLRKWKFLLIGKEVDSFIADKYESHKSKGKRFLVEAVRNYEIYALTWDDIFKIFDSRHKHLIDKMEFRSSVIEELDLKGVHFNRDASDELTKKAS